MYHTYRIYKAELLVLTKLPAGGRSKNGKSVIKHIHIYMVTLGNYRCKAGKAVNVLMGVI